MLNNPKKQKKKKYRENVKINKSNPKEDIRIEILS
jgi:hypothetical protein